MVRDRDKYFGEREWARHHGIEDPPEEFLASVHRRNILAFVIIVPLVIVFGVTWFSHHLVLCAIAAALLAGVFLGLYVASKA
jgi:hypothetical protein